MSEKYWLDKMNANPRYREIWEKIKELPFNETTEIILDLESKLAESEKTEDGAFWFEKWQHKKRDYDSVYKAYIENCAEVDQLKQQLAEEKNRSKKLNHEAQKYYEDAYCNNFQNQKAIAELEKVKVKLNEEINNASVLLDPVEYEDYHELLGVIRGYKLSVDQINQQINELKGEKYG